MGVSSSVDLDKNSVDSSGRIVVGSTPQKGWAVYQLFDLSLLLQGDDAQWGKLHRFVSKIVGSLARGGDAEYQKEQKDALRGVSL